jgi:hypothetical protein
VVPFRAEIEAQVRAGFTHPGGLRPRILFADADDYSTVRGAAAIVLSGRWRWGSDPSWMPPFGCSVSRPARAA